MVSFSPTVDRSISYEASLLRTSQSDKANPISCELSRRFDRTFDVIPVNNHVRTRSPSVYSSCSWEPEDASLEKDPRRLCTSATNQHEKGSLRRSSETSTGGDSIMSLPMPTSLHFTDQILSKLKVSLADLQTELLEKLPKTFLGLLRRELHEVNADSIRLQNEICVDVKRFVTMASAQMSKMCSTEPQDVKTAKSEERASKNSVTPHIGPFLSDDFKKGLVKDVAALVSEDLRNFHRREFGQQQQESLVKAGDVLICQLEAHSKIVIQHLTDLLAELSGKSYSMPKRPRVTKTRGKARTSESRGRDSTATTEESLPYVTSPCLTPPPAPPLPATTPQIVKPLGAVAAPEAEGPTTSGAIGRDWDDIEKRCNHQFRLSAVIADASIQLEKRTGSHKGGVEAADKRVPNEPNQISELKAVEECSEVPCLDVQSKSENSEELESSAEHQKSFLERMAEVNSLRAKQDVESGFSRFVKSTQFDCIAAFFVVLSAILLGVQTSYEAQNPFATEPIAFKIIDVFLAVVFTVEVAVRLYVYGWEAFFFYAGRSWNIYDFTMVVTTNIDVFFKVCLRQTHTYALLETLGVLRLTRLGKLMRILRMVGLVNELKMMVYLINASLHSFVWALVLMVLMIWIVAIYYTEVVTKLVREKRLAQADVAEQWGSVSRSVLSLFMSISGGDDWSTFIGPIAADFGIMGSVNIAFFSVYVAFMILVITNLVTGVFVDGAQRLVSNEKDQEFLRQSQVLFGAADENGDMEISWVEFLELIDTDGMREYFKACDFNKKAAMGLFRMLDVDNSGHLSVDEFIFGCLRLRGMARSVDLVHLTIVIVDCERRRDCQAVEFSRHLAHLTAQLSRMKTMTESICRLCNLDVSPTLPEAVTSEQLIKTGELARKSKTPPLTPSVMFSTSTDSRDSQKRRSCLVGRGGISKYTVKDR
eukprot:TRINITY_DN69018_c0_g1_i1.p1 TRINITY_DN69018_c0_g1~~TRINITY_DN69018_c0_g1_i1.p1  ORF type:complete len:933 (-),score=120.64 TRINITY_DN69018_c0_g1_i1:14-2812(-)